MAASVLLLIYGDGDWSRPAEREQTRALIPNVVMKTVAGGGHSLPLDRPRELSELIVSFAGARAARDPDEAKHNPAGAA